MQASILILKEKGMKNKILEMVSSALILAIELWNMQNSYSTPTNINLQYQKLNLPSQKLWSMVANQYQGKSYINTWTDLS